MKYKAIVFDNIGVILCENHKKWSRKIGGYFKIPWKDIYWFYSRQKAWSLYKKGKISETEFWKRGNLAFGRNLEIGILKKMARKARRPRKQITSLIRRLKKNYLLGLLNNEGREWDDYSFKKEPFYFLFDIHLASYHFGVAKPEKRIYQLLIRKLKKFKIKPEETVYIDDYVRNLEPAKKMGFATIHYKSYNQLDKRLKNLKVI